MPKYLIDAWHDIRHGVNIEIYFLASFVVVVLILKLLHIASTETVLSTIPILVLLIALGMVKDRKISLSLAAKVDQLEKSTHQLTDELRIDIFSGQAALTPALMNYVEKNRPRRAHLIQYGATYLHELPSA